MVRRSLINALTEARLFSLVDPFGNNPDSDLDLNSEITSFDQVVEGEVNFADFGLILEFSRSDNKVPVWSYRTEARVEQEGEIKFSAAMSEAVKEAITRAIAEMEKSRELKEVPDLLEQGEERRSKD